MEKVFDVLTSLSMCIFGFYSSSLHLTSHETLIPNNLSVLMRKGSYGWAFALLVLDLILSIFVGPFYALDASLSCICALCISLYAFLFFFFFFFCFFLHLILLIYLCFMCVKIQNHIKIQKFKKFDRICLSTYHMWVWPSTFVLMA